MNLGGCATLERHLCVHITNGTIFCMLFILGDDRQDTLRIASCAISRARTGEISMLPRGAVIILANSFLVHPSLLLQYMLMIGGMLRKLKDKKKGACDALEERIVIAVKILEPCFTA